MLEEIGQPYRAEYLGYDGSLKTPEFLAMNPMGKVPTLRHGDVVVTECAAICAYLADVFPQAGLAPPPGSTARGPYYRWLFFAAGPTEAAITNRMFGFEVPAAKQMSIGYGSFAAVMDTMEAAVSGGDYLAGNAFSAADVYFGSQIGFGLRFGTIEKRPAFEAYWARIATRPAAVRAAAIDDEAMAHK
jgi:glutathione S-transferase